MNLLRQLRDCRDTLTHRGPDSAGDWYDPRVYVGHRRLSILDTSAAGNQPLVSADGQCVLAVNGEIYNFKELRTLLQEDFSFVSSSDSEVLLHGYEAWGMDGLLSRVEGMFAFSLYDAAKGHLYLARDRFGIKPLYVWKDGAHFAWASELKALRTLSQVDASFFSSLSVDYSAVYDFLTYLYVPTPKSLYRHVQKLEPGCYLAVDLQDSTTKLNRYWSIDSVIGTGSLLSQDDVLQLLTEAVGQQLGSDVPLGFFLSGGVDSSAVVAIARSLDTPLSTFSIGFDAVDSELPYASAVAMHVGAEHRDQTLDQSAAVKLTHRMPVLYDEPFADTSALPTYLISQMASDDVKVVLTGDGGDEVFGGYDRYTRFQRHNMLRDSRAGLGATATIKRRLPTAKRLLRGIERYVLLDGFASYTRWMGGMIASEKQRYRHAWCIPADYDDYWHFRAHYNPALHPRLALQRMDLLTYLPDDILTKVDRASMAHGLEARVPLLATKLVEAAFSVPPSVLGTGKSLLKAAVAELLPPGILERRKQGFSVPSHTWRHGVFDEKLSRQEALLYQGYPELIDI